MSFINRHISGPTQFFLTVAVAIWLSVYLLLREEARAEDIFIMSARIFVSTLPPTQDSDTSDGFEPGDIVYDANIAETWRPCLHPAGNIGAVASKQKT